MRAIGVSINDHQPDSALGIIETGLIDTVQVIYNIFDQTPERNLFPACMKHDIGVLARVPFDEGSLTGRINEETVFPEGDFRASYFRGDRKKQVEDHVAAIVQDLNLRDATHLAELAIRFCLSHPAVSTVIPGMRSMSSVEGNVMAVGQGPASRQHSRHSAYACVGSEFLLLMSGVQLISEALFDTVSEGASASPRLRMNHNFHAGAEDNPHRFLNVLLRGTYIRPHRHLTPPKAESFIALQGIADVILFDDAGVETARYRLGADSPEGRLWGVDLPVGVWHTILPRSERVVCFEVKPGPWAPATDKEFAAWAPAEGHPDAAAYRDGLLSGSVSQSDY